METQQKKSVSLDALEANEQASMQVLDVRGKLLAWYWHFAGPGHPMAEAQKKRIAEEGIADRRAKEQSQTNFKKWKAPQQTPEEIHDANIDYVLERLLGWSEIEMDGKSFEFSREAARTLLKDPRKAALLQQAIDFIQAENSFTQSSAGT